MSLKIIMLSALKDKLRYIKFLKSLFIGNWFQSGSAKAEVVRSTPPAGAGSKVFREKTWELSNDVIWLGIA